MWLDTTVRGTDHPDGRTGLALLVGLVAVALGPMVIVVVTLPVIVLLACFALDTRTPAGGSITPTTGAP